MHLSIEQHCKYLFISSLCLAMIRLKRWKKDHMPFGICRGCFSTFKSMIVLSINAKAFDREPQLEWKQLLGMAVGWLESDFIE